MSNANVQKERALLSVESSCLYEDGIFTAFINTAKSESKAQVS